MDQEISTNPFADDKLHEECGIFGIWGKPDAAAFVALGLHALQHRGQEASGIVTCDDSKFYMERREGLVGDQFSVGGPIDKLRGPTGIGHVRYSTTGGSLNRNIQPFFADVANGGIAIAHNGNLTNAYALRQRLVRNGSIFYSTSDTECIVHLVATSRAGQIVDRLVDALKQVEGAYSLVALTRKKLIGVRDPLGVRPLVIGKVDGAYVFASETCALDIIDAEFVREVEPGEIVVISDEGLQSYKPFPPQRPRFCIFEYVYFARPDSMIEGQGVYEVRKNIGAELAREAPVEADMVVPVPDSGVPGAIGFAEASNIPFELGIIRNHYVGRTFIEPSDHIRHLGVRLKHNANRARLKGKRVVLIDDSIVRGTTSKKIIKMVRDAGAAEVHMRIASPPTTDSCFYGVDTPEKKNLLAANYTVAEMCRFIEADSLHFISINGLYRALRHARRDAKATRYCDACFTGDYPTALTDRDSETDGGQLSLLAV
ncbi:MAG: amidophosphoribosyltransferase [Alphaproteobacteria bacterium]|nr:amidophosphoribosyltransferase [Alphaproteobacteria bacterium]